MEQNFETCLYNVVDAAKIQKDEPMKKHNLPDRWSGRLFYHAIE